MLRLPRAGGIDDVPATLDAVVNAEIDGLGTGPRRLVRYASVLGRSFRVAVLRELLMAEGLRLDLATLREVGRILERDGHDRVRFRQEMHREVAYEGLTYKRRRELHLRAGEITERMAGDSPETVADLLAMHFALGHDHSRAWLYARIAGDRARERYANVEAVTQYQRAIDAGRRLGDAARAELREVWRVLGDVREQLGMFEDAITAYRNAAAARRGRSGRARRPAVAPRTGSHAPRCLSAGVGRGEPRRCAAGRSHGSGGGVGAGTADRAPGMVAPGAATGGPGGGARRRAPSKRRGSRATTPRLARAYLVSDWANRVLGISDAAAYGELALELYERTGDLDGAAKASNNLGGDRVLRRPLGRRPAVVPARARLLRQRAVTTRRRRSPARNLGELLVSRGAFAEAESVLHDAIRVLRAAGAIDDLLFAEIQLGRLLVERGDAEDAVDLLARVRADAADVGQVGYAFEAALQLASGQSGLARYDDALGTLDDAVRDVGFVDPVYQPSLARVRAAALAGCGRVDDAIRELDEGLASAREQGLAYEEALLLHAAARLEHGSGARPADATLDAMTAIFTGLSLELPPWDGIAFPAGDVTDLDGDAQALA